MLKLSDRAPLAYAASPRFVSQDAAKALQLTLDMVSALHDIMCYLVGFARLGNLSVGVSGARSRAPLAADWGGTEGIGEHLRRQHAPTQTGGGAFLCLKRRCLNDYSYLFNKNP